MNVVLLATMLFVSQAKEAPSDWRTTTAKNGLFSFAMPAEPTERRVSQTSKVGETFDILEYSCVVDRCIYRVEQGKMPVRIPDEHLEGALDKFRETTAQKTKLVLENRTTVNGWPAREWIVEAPLRPGGQPSTIAMLVLYADGSVYQVRVLPLDAGIKPKDYRKFFNAFKPTKPGPKSNTSKNKNG